MELDLHGYSVEEATSSILMSFLSFLTSSFETELVVITGKGTLAMQTTFLELIRDENSLSYEPINGGGAFLVKKRH